jgi:hypothetical protein
MIIDGCPVALREVFFFNGKSIKNVRPAKKKYR